MRKRVLSGHHEPLEGVFGAARIYASHKRHCELWRSWESAADALLDAALDGMPAGTLLVKAFEAELVGCWNEFVSSTQFN